MKNLKPLLITITLFISFNTFAQINTIVTAVPFLRINPNANAMGMYGIDVVSTGSNTQGSAEYNPARMFESRMNVFGTYMPWLGALDLNDVYLADIGGSYNFNDRHAVGLYGKYFEFGSDAGNADEMKFGAAYAFKANDHFSLGLNVNYIRSNLFNRLNPINAFPGETLAFGLGFLYKNNFNIGQTSKIAYTFGLAVQDLGQRISYTNSSIGDYIPTNLGLGGTFGYKELFQNFDLNFAYQFSKLLVPTASVADEDNNNVPDYRERSFFDAILTSFGDAPNGFSEEMQEINLSQTLEGVYHFSSNWSAALRLGYFYEHRNKGDRKILQTSGQIKFKTFYVNIGHILPRSESNPLDNTFSFNLGYQVDL